MARYKIVRTFQGDGIPSKVLKQGLTLAQAQAWCRDPETSSKTAVRPENVALTARCGAWMDGFDVDTRPKAASYRMGVRWIALNDEPCDRDPESIAGYISTLLLADLFGKDPADVAQDIIKVREAQ